MVYTEAEPGRNGVADYARTLCAALAESGTDVTSLTAANWTFAELRALRSTLRRLRPDILHLQYPVHAKDGKRRLGLQLLNAFYPAVVTVHDNSRWPRWSGRASLAAFLPRARHVLFTTGFERDYALGWAPLLRSKSSVIPIGTNIAPSPSAERDPANVVSFGLIRPGKGLESVLELARLSLANGRRFDVTVVGQVAEREGRYAEDLRTVAALLPLTWETGLDDATTGERLGRAPIAYLPFPDGASERRGSLLACLAAGCAVVTTEGDQTPPEMRHAVAIADTPAAAFNVVHGLLSDEPRRKALSEAGMAYARGFEWASIAAQHNQLYQGLARK
jgi:glycosyltransferase involved in cell wall biosynthesis